MEAGSSRSLKVFPKHYRLLGCLLHLVIVFSGLLTRPWCSADLDAATFGLSQPTTARIVPSFQALSVDDWITTFCACVSARLRVLYAAVPHSRSMETVRCPGSLDAQLSRLVKQAERDGKMRMELVSQAGECILAAGAARSLLHLRTESNLPTANWRFLDGLGRSWMPQLNLSRAFMIDDRRGGKTWAGSCASLL